MKIVERPIGWTRSFKEQKEFDALVAELRVLYPPKPRPVCPEGMSKEEFIISLQAASTAATLRRTDEEQAVWNARPLPTNWLANPEAKTNDESVGMRALDPTEISHFEAIRRRPKNSQGQSTASGTTAEGRERGIQGFIYTPGASVTKSEVETRGVNLIQYETKPMTEVWVEMPWYKALFHRLKGNKIRQEIKGK